MKLINRKVICVSLIVFSLLLVGCGKSETNKEDEQINLTGEWEQIHDKNTNAYHVATIAVNTISIYWYNENDKTKALYWAGSFEPPAIDEDAYSWESVNDHDKTNTAMLASSDDTKRFSYKNQEIVYETSAMGVTKEIHLKQISVGEGYDVPKLEEKLGETESTTSNSTPIVSDSANIESDSLAEIKGAVFVGAGGSAITLYDDGTADYYWIREGEVKKDNTWMQKGNVITVSLSSLKCDIYATIYENNSTLLFQSDSENWDDELFVGVGSIQYKPSEDEYYQLVQAAQTEFQKAKEKLESQEENEAVKEPEEIQEAENSDVSSGEVNPELKAFLDEYESFMDEYVEFMKRYKDSGNPTEMLSDYLKMMERYADFVQKAEQYDADEMSAADAAYYLDVTTRVSKKMLEVAY